MSIEINRSDRDQIQGLFSELLLTKAPELQENSGAMRFIALSALNLAEEHSAQALFEVAKVLPWLGVYRLWEEGASVEEVSRVLLEQGLVQYQSDGLIIRRLLRVLEERPSSIRRTPGLAPTTAAELKSEALQGLFRSEERLKAFMALPTEERRQTALGDSELLLAVIELEIEELLPPWAVERPSPALEAFARFEAAGFLQAPGELARLSERSLRFEASLTEHLHSHDLLVPIRVALAMAPASESPSSTPSEQELKNFLTKSSLFAADTALLDLTVALIQCRHRALAHLSGAANLSIMSPWIEYLRGPCAEFGESRGLTLREAINFAHYSLHLVNLFDLATYDGGPPNEDSRRALLDLEEELKEFALAGQRAGLRDRQANLARYEEARWRSDASYDYLADRLARLSGGWRQGQDPGPAGKAPLLRGALAEKFRALVKDSASSKELAELQALLQNINFVGHHWLSELSPDGVLRFMTFTLTKTRGLSVQRDEGPLFVDLTPLGEWLKQGGAQRRQEILEFLLQQQSASGPVSAEKSSGELGLIAVENPRGVVISMAQDAQFEALLTLLAGAAGDDELFEPLLNRLRSLLKRSRSSAREGRPARTLSSPESPEAPGGDRGLTG